jgi:hypothetical protein
MSFVFNFQSHFDPKDIKEIFKRFNTDNKVDDETGEDGLDANEFETMILSFAEEKNEPFGNHHGH